MTQADAPVCACAEPSCTHGGWSHGRGATGRGVPLRPAPRDGAADAPAAGRVRVSPGQRPQIHAAHECHTVECAKAETSGALSRRVPYALDKRGYFRVLLEHARWRADEDLACCAVGRSGRAAVQLTTQAV